MNLSLETEAKYACLYAGAVWGTFLDSPLRAWVCWTSGLLSVLPLI